MKARRTKWFLAALLTMLGVGATPAYAIQAGITLDIHQDIGPNNPDLWPNDFHIEGLICSTDGVLPTVIAHIDGPFVHFTYTMTKINPDDPADCWYWFEATWWNDPGTGYIPYCTVIHLGLLFDVDAANVIIDLIGWWTRDGVAVGHIFGGLGNDGFAPTIGFNVADTVSPQVVTIGNGFLNPPPPWLPPIQPPIPPEPPPWPPAGLELTVLRMDVVAFAPDSPPDFGELYEGGAQQSYPWVPVVYGDGEPIHPGRPHIMQPDSFFDVFLDIGKSDGFRTLTPTPVQPGGFLVMRQLAGFVNNAGQYEERWFWELHEGQSITEACCFSDGTCQDLEPPLCIEFGGMPLGPGTSCFPNNPCPQPELGACCYGTDVILCVIVDPVTCQQHLNGQWKGPGTNCDDLNGNNIADICEGGTELGACCYGTVAPLCVITDPITCEQQLYGQWMGPGTNCDDLNGNNIADICEEPIELGACCFGDDPIQCVITDPITCMEQLNGLWMGLGTNCDDLNSNGIADICELGPEDYEIEFSLDIGSDTELSDPMWPDPDLEVFDPGDVYWWRGPLLPVCGLDGFKDDQRIFGQDPNPNPPDCGQPPATRVPVGQGSPGMYRQFFDLDGHDQLDVSLHEQFELYGQPLSMPIPPWPSPCIHTPKHLLISYDDDQAPGWPVNDVPTTVPSAIGQIYGTTAAQDEVIEVNVQVMPVPPYPVTGIYPFADEVGVHQSMAPNPDIGDEDDDDVDSLDIVPSEDACPFWYFTADHEAYQFTLDPGDVYEVLLGGGFVLVVDDVNNLGIPDDTDVDAFEFTWLEHPEFGAGLALLFSVDENDPLTPQDESGGLDPRTIYGSFLTGFFFPVTEPLMDDIDALTIWHRPLHEDQTGACCLPDGTCADGWTLTQCVAGSGLWQGPGTLCATTNCCVTCPGDVNSDGRVNGLDIQCFVDCILNGSAMPPCNCACADFNGSVPPGMDDVQPFVQELLNTTVCP